MDTDLIQSKENFYKNYYWEFEVCADPRTDLC